MEASLEKMPEVTDQPDKPEQKEKNGFDVKTELSKLPKKPGVYIMHDSADTILYVGKAVNLHNRVRSYFRANIGRGPAIDQMVKQIAYFEYIVTDSELEALVLDNNLIKENRPKYNTMLVDDKTYPYIKVTVGEPYPRLVFCRTMKKDKSRYFGPFTSGDAVRNTIELLNRMFMLRDCSRNLPRDAGKDRPCLNYHMKRCCAPCIKGNVSEEEYRSRIECVLSFLSGDHKSVVDMLTERMNKASEELDFEAAARDRDLIRDVISVTEKQKMSESIGENRDILGIAKEEENPDADAVIQTFYVRDGRLIGREHFYMTHVGSVPKSEILSDFIRQFYAGTPFIPKQIMLPEDLDDRAVIEEWLTSVKGQKVTLEVPIRGQKSKLVALAEENAALILGKDRERLKREEGRTIGAVREIASLIGIEKADRMEAYDISNISGFANVGSMVVYEKGKPKRSDYRKFSIKTVSGPNDYACMHEVLTRRFEHGLEEKKELEEENRTEEYSKFAKFPDLILMDGGKGQVNIALEVLGELGLSIPVAGMVKDDDHRTRGLYYNNIEVPIDARSEGFMLITRIQDEAHRFAIEYHRSQRSAAQTKSILDEIPGVGPARRKALMRTFASVDEIKKADVAELVKVPEIDSRAAQQIYEFFHSC